MNHNDYWRLMGCLRRAKDNIEQVMQPFCAQHDLTPSQLRMLLALHFEGPQTAGALARCTDMAVANASAMYKKLTLAGLVDRRRNAADERQVLVRLTGKGQALVKDFLDQKQASLQALQQQLQPGDIDKIEEGLEQLARILETRSQP